MDGKYRGRQEGTGRKLEGSGREHEACEAMRVDQLAAPPGWHPLAPEGGSDDACGEGGVDSDEFGGGGGSDGGVGSGHNGHKLIIGLESGNLLVTPMQQRGD